MATKIYVKGLAEGITDVQFTANDIDEIEMGKSFFHEETAQDLFPNSYQNISKVTLLGTGTDPALGNAIVADAFKGCTGLQTFYVESLMAWTNCELGNEYSNPCFYSNSIYEMGEANPITSLVASDFVPNATAAKAYSFINCLPLTSVSLPDGMTTIGTKAFSGCINIEDFSTPNTIASVAGNALVGLPKSLFTETATIDGYVLKMFHGYVVEAPSGITSINLTSTKGMLAGTFMQYSTLQAITIGPQWTEIPDNGFRECTALTSITIPANITHIGETAFVDCESITSVVFQRGGISIDADAFARSFASTWTVSIPTLRDWLTMAFANFDSSPANNLISPYSPLLIGGQPPQNNVVVPLEVTRIYTATFVPWFSLKNLTLTFEGANIYFETDAFGYGFYGHKDIHIPSLSVWLTYTFEDDSSTPCYSGGAGLYVGEEWLETLNIPDGIEHIKDYAFSHVIVGLEGEINIPDSVQTIGTRAFNLREPGLYRSRPCSIGKNVKSIGDEAFAIDGIYSPTRITFRGNCPQELGTNIFSASLRSPIHVPSNSTGWERLFAKYPNAEILYDQPPIS